MDKSDYEYEKDSKKEYGEDVYDSSKYDDHEFDYTDDEEEDK